MRLLSWQMRLPECHIPVSIPRQAAGKYTRNKNRYFSFRVKRFMIIKNDENEELKMRRKR